MIDRGEDGVGESGSFLRELRRLVTESGRDLREVFAAAGVPIAVLDGLPAEVERVAWTKWKRLASELGIASEHMLRPMLAEFDPWLLPLLDELMAMPPMPGSVQSTALDVTPTPTREV